MEDAFSSLMRERTETKQGRSASRENKTKSGSDMLDLSFVLLRVCDSRSVSRSRCRRSVSQCYKYAQRHFCTKYTKKGRWTEREVEILFNQVELLGPKWTAVAEKIGRPPDACYYKYRDTKHRWRNPSSVDSSGSSTSSSSSATIDASASSSSSSSSSVSTSGFQGAGARKRAETEAWTKAEFERLLLLVRQHNKDPFKVSASVRFTVVGLRDDDAVYGQAKGWDEEERMQKTPKAI